MCPHDMDHNGQKDSCNELRQRFHWEWRIESTGTRGFLPSDDHPFHVSSETGGVPDPVQHAQQRMELNACSYIRVEMCSGQISVLLAPMLKLSTITCWNVSCYNHIRNVRARSYHSHSPSGSDLELFHCQNANH